ncbi:iron chelate uptake ABC transporter family permease subunit [Aliagarivorans marinus]|uniref:iron chelate uptake ABC transporter family permease subunit n=1 Tax=Aliagarivorans marinus TaxID=561965 RepID=UPI00042027D2|nr:iron chelate uptake ABC transporter family permease subunit [Aliagarivorans marinus]
MRNSTKLILLSVATLAIIALFLGKGLDAYNYRFFLSRRIPKVLAILLAATAISWSSLVFQTVTNNRILTPSILGFDSLYVMIQVLLVVLAGSLSPLVIQPMLNFSVTTAIMAGLSLSLFAWYFYGKQRDLFSLLLIGIICSSLFSSVTGFFTMVIDPSEFMAIQASMFASFNNVNGALVYWAIAPMLLCLALLLKLAPKLDVLWLGPDNATSLGINVRKLTLQIMALVSVLISVATALVGPVLFFGLIVVSLTRQLFNSYQHRLLLPASSALAAFLLLTGQWIVENLMAFETTISVIINFVGGSYFLLLLARNKVN